MKKANFSIPLSTELLETWKRSHYDAMTNNAFPLPATWIFSLNREIQEQLKKMSLTGLQSSWNSFTKGLLFNDELLLFFQLSNESNKKQLSYFFSLDGNYHAFVGLSELELLNHEKLDLLKKDFEFLGDIMISQVLSMEEILSDRDDVDFVTHWQQEEYEGRAFFIRNSREDILATLEAELILNDLSSSISSIQ